MNIDRLIDFNEKKRELAPLHTLILYRWICRHAIQQEHNARSAARRTRRQLKKGQISVFQQARARKHLELYRQVAESCDDQLDQLGGALSDFTVFDLVFHHAECQDPGCDFVPNDDSMPLFHAVLANFMAEMGRNRELRSVLDKGFKEFFPGVQRMYLQPPGPDGRRAAYQEQSPLVVHRPDGTTRTVDRPMRLIGYTQPGAKP